MDGFDNATWQALGLVLTIVGLGASAVVWRLRGPARGLRGVAWSLLPLAAGLTGVLRLGWDVIDAVGRWATRLVFSPVVWLGLVVAMVSVVLFVVSGFLLRRSGSSTGTPATTAPTRRRALPKDASAPPATTGKSGAGDDMADIEAILRKHGIQ